MFEKYDGVRGFWNPHHKTFFSRTGKPFLFPSHITSAMPHIFLDGELWSVEFVIFIPHTTSFSLFSGLEETHFKKL
jgi:ATP-dependent DNA ligase